VAADKWLEQALAENTRLKALAADVHAAEAAIGLAYKARMPDTSVGFMADAKMSPVLYRPWGTVSIPLWRDKLAAQVAEAQANKRAGEARLTAEQIGLAVDVANGRCVSRDHGNRTYRRLAQAAAIARGMRWPTWPGRWISRI
jgi:outer membrane protein TolC